MTVPNVFDQLMAGGTLSDLGLGTEGGRLLVEKLKAPPAKVVRRLAAGGFDAQVTTGFPKARKVRWEGLHFRKCDLTRVALIASEVVDCVFEGCKLQRLFFWESRVESCRFVGCDLREAALGGIENARPRPNGFVNVEFARCDLRGAAHSCETYRHCRFGDCRMDKADLLGAVFEDCVFRGNLEETTFRSYDPQFPKLPRNRMLRCDLRGAGLRSCQFLDIDLDSVLLPDDPELVVLPRGPVDLLAWSSRLDEGDNKQKLWYIDQVRKRMGTPGLFSLSLIRDLFSGREIELLKSIAKRNA